MNDAQKLHLMVLTQLGLPTALAQRAVETERPTLENLVDVDESTIYLYGEVMNETWRNLYEEWFGESNNVSNQSFRADLAKLSGDITLRVMSVGGDVWEAAGIHGALNEYRSKGNKVNVVIDGLAASAATIIMLASDEIAIQPMASLMIHRMEGGAHGNADEIIAFGEFMRKSEGEGVKLYVEKAKVGKAEIEQAMEKQTWITASEAVDTYGLCDRVLDGEESPPPDSAAPKMQHRIAQRFDALRRIGTTQGD